jgi:formylglycine-generating enzyme
VPGGTVLRANDAGADGLYPDTSLPASVSTFRLDTYEVTVGRFRQFIASGTATQEDPPAPNAGAHAKIPNSGWDAAWNLELAVDAASLRAALACDVDYQTWTDVPAGNEQRPINCVTWYEAMAFCAWDQGHVPTEAEWHYAASGGAEQRAFPWSTPPGSTAIDCAQANHGGSSWPSTACASAGPVEVGTGSGSGRWGQVDLAGNVLEWVMDAPTNGSQYPPVCVDCANLSPSTWRVYRGGSFLNVPAMLRVPARQFDDPRTRDAAIGFRCARG